MAFLSDFDSNLTQFLSSFDRKIQRAFFTNKAKVILLTSIAKPLQVGRPLQEIIDYLYYYSHSKTIKKIAKDMRAQLAIDGRISPALSHWMNNTELAVITSTESSGSESFARGMMSLAEDIDARSDTSSSAIKSLLYPLVIAVASSYAIVGLVDKFSRQWEMMKKGGDAIDQIKFFAHFYSDIAPFMIIGGIILCFTVKYLSRIYTGQYRRLLDNNIFLTERMRSASRFIGVYGLLKKYGLSLSDILAEADKNETPYLRSHLKKMRKLMAMGNTSEVSNINTGLLSARDIATLTLYAQADEKYYAQALNAAVSDINKSLLNRSKIITLLVALSLGAIAFANVLMIVSVLFN